MYKLESRNKGLENNLHSYCCHGVIATVTFEMLIIPYSLAGQQHSTR